MFAALEILKNASPYDDAKLFYWYREAKNSNAEVDYVVQYRNRILPIENGAQQKKKRCAAKHPPLRTTLTLRRHRELHLAAFGRNCIHFDAIHRERSRRKILHALDIEDFANVRLKRHSRYLRSIAEFQTAATFDNTLIFVTSLCLLPMILKSWRKY